MSVTSNSVATEGQEAVVVRSIVPGAMVGGAPTFGAPPPRTVRAPLAPG
jgi:hypothetical protein